MRYVEAAGMLLLILLATLTVFYARREFIARRGGTIGMSMRLSNLVNGRGWAPGIGRFSGDELRWYRLFSLGLRPRRVLLRYDITVEGRRPPQGPERLTMPESWIVLRCTAGRRSAYSRREQSEPVEIALAESAVTGFMSWIESAPPKALRQR